MGETEARPLRGRAVAIVMADQSGTVRLPLEGVQGGTRPAFLHLLKKALLRQCLFGVAICGKIEWIIKDPMIVC